MSLFGFGNIAFDKSNGDRTKGPLAALEKNQFEKTRLRYPIDLGQTDKAHYLVFYIREQTRTKFGSGAGGAANKNALEDASRRKSEMKSSSGRGVKKTEKALKKSRGRSRSLALAGGRSRSRALAGGRTRKHRRH